MDYWKHAELGTEISGLPGTPVSLFATHPTTSRKSPARKLRCIAGTGTITVTMPSGAGIVMNLAPGDEETGEFYAITAASSVTNVRASW